MYYIPLPLWTSCILSYKYKCISKYKYKYKYKDKYIKGSNDTGWMKWGQCGAHAYYAEHRNQAPPSSRDGTLCWTSCPLLSRPESDSPLPNKLAKFGRCGSQDALVQAYIVIVIIRLGSTT